MAQLLKQYEHLDAAETVFFNRELENIEREFLEVKKVALKGLRIVPVKSDMPGYTERHTYRWMDGFGKAKRIASPDENLPTNDVKVGEVSQRLQAYGSAFGYSIDEIRASAALNRPLDRDRLTWTRKVLDVSLDDVITNGDAEAGLVGFLGLSGVLTHDIPNGAGGQPLWTTKTPDEILKDLNALKSKVRTQTGEVEEVTRYLLPPEADEIIKNTPRSSTSDTTIKEFFLDNNPGMEIMSWERLAAAGPGGGGLMVAYNPRPENLHLLLPVAFEQLAPQLVGFSYKVNCRFKTGGVIAPYPKSIIKSATAAITAAP